MFGTADSLIFVWMCGWQFLAATSQLSSGSNVTNCEFQGHFPESFVPWAVVIRPSRHSIFLAAIISETILLAKGETFRDTSHRFKMIPFANYTVQAGSHPEDHHKKDIVQIVNVSYIKPHPDLPSATTDHYWANLAHDWVLVYLKEPIKFINGFSPICLPSSELIGKLKHSTAKTVANLSDVSIHGTIRTTNQTQISYSIKLENWNKCHGLWEANPVTRRFPYYNRVCGNVIEPSQKNKSCTIRDSGAVLVQNKKWTLIGFQNIRLKRGAVCDDSMTIYVSLLMSDDLQWIQDDIKCGHRKFSCDNGTKCLDLNTVCDGRKYQCRDKSDQNSFYCNALHACEHNQFTCSKGLAAYCIPGINKKTGRAAKNCNGVKDCPNGEDEDAELCATNSSVYMIWIYIGVGVVTLLISSLIIGCTVRRRNLRDLTEEELMDFFEGERHLQIDEQEGLAGHDTAGDEGEGRTHEHDILYIDDGTTSLVQPSSEPGLEFCPEVVRRRGYDTSLDFDARNPSQCTLGHQIGEGSFGIVKKGYVHGKPAAIKLPNISIEVNSFKVLLLELKILKYIHDAAGDTGHPNVLRFIGADTKLIRQRVLFVALEYCENGNIHDFIGINKAHFQANICGRPAMHFQVDPQRPRYSTVVTEDVSEPLRYSMDSECLQRLIRWAAQIAAGMKFLSHKIIHLDLATRNVLLDSNLVAKVGDFGLSRKVYEKDYYKLKRKDPLPFAWLALEVLTANKCLLNSDVWSYGVTIWELFSLCEEPWEDIRDDRELRSMLLNGQRLERPTYASLEMYEHMLACWNKEPSQRPSFGELESFFENLLRPPVNTSLFAEV